jgi:hypothetical protein
MLTSIHCPNCTKRLRIPGNIAGKSIRCPACNETIRLESTEKKSRDGTWANRPVLPWVIAGSAAMLWLATLTFTVIGQSRTSSIAQSLAEAETELQTIKSQNDELRKQMTIAEQELLNATDKIGKLEADLHKLEKQLPGKLDGSGGGQPAKADKTRTSPEKSTAYYRLF